MCSKCVSNVFKCVWHTFETSTFSNVRQTHLNTFETHLKHIWGTFNVSKCVLNKHLNTFDLLFTTVTQKPLKSGDLQCAQNTFEHIWNTFETHLNHKHISTHWGTFGHIWAQNTFEHIGDIKCAQMCLSCQMCEGTFEHRWNTCETQMRNISTVFNVFRITPLRSGPQQRPCDVCSSVLHGH